MEDTATVIENVLPILTTIAALTIPVMVKYILELSQLMPQITTTFTSCLGAECDCPIE